MNPHALSFTDSHRSAETFISQRRPAGISPVGVEAIAEWPRHLVYHVYPVRDSVWRENVRELQRRAGLFTGQRIVRVALDATTESREVVQAELNGLRADVRFVDNDHRMGEALTLLSALDDVIPRGGLTFYAHAKGVTHRDASVVFGVWARQMYSLLDRFDEVASRLCRHGFCGLVRSTGQPIAEGIHEWHYPGSFYWFRNDVVTKRGWATGASSRFFSEQFPSQIIRFTESAAIHSELLFDNPYRRDTWLALADSENRAEQRSLWHRGNREPAHVDDVPIEARLPPPTARWFLTGMPPSLDTQFLRSLPLTLPAQVFESHPTPKPTDLPLVSPARFHGEPTRHMIYHIWPTNQSDSWRWNVRELLRRIELFDGVRAIAVAVDEETATLAEVQAEFVGVRVDRWIELRNDSLEMDPPSVHRKSPLSIQRFFGQGASFLELLQTLPADQNSVTWYGHSKGVRYSESDAHFGVARRWAALMYRVCLDHWSEVLQSLSLFPMTGPFKRYSDFDIPQTWHWHYSGTFFWFRNLDVFERPEWPQLLPTYGAVEIWPSCVFRAQETGCLFGDDAQSLYLEKDLTPWEAAIRTWPEATIVSANNVNERQFFELEMEAGYTNEKWRDLLGVHRLAARAVQQLGVRTVLEIGSGLGPFLVAAKELSLDAVGMGINHLEKDFAMTRGISHKQYAISNVSDYRIERPVDAIVSIEVFEHCSDAELHPLVQQFAANCKWFYFTSTPHPTTPEADARGGHVNLKTKEAWIVFFARYGLRFVREDHTIVPWGLLFAT